MKEKKLLKQLRTAMNGAEPTTSTLRMYKEIWIDKLRYKTIKLQKMIERGKRVMDNANFERDQKSFFKKAEESTEYERTDPEMDQFIEF